MICNINHIKLTKLLFLFLLIKDKMLDKDDTNMHIYVYVYTRSNYCFKGKVFFFSSFFSFFGLLVVLLGMERIIEMAKWNLLIREKSANQALQKCE